MVAAQLYHSLLQLIPGRRKTGPLVPSEPRRT